MDYLSWNDEIGAKFFTPDAKGRRVYLYVTSELIREIGKPSNVGFADFLSALRKGPDWVSHGNVCERAYQASSSWRKRRLRYPLILPTSASSRWLRVSKGSLRHTPTIPAYANCLAKTLPPAPTGDFPRCGISGTISKHGHKRIEPES